MSRSSFARLVAWTACLFLLACEPSAVPPSDGAVDADARTRADSGPVEPCESDAQCRDELFCNGAERCAPGAAGADARGCVSADSPRCMESQTCDEDMERCFSDCDVESDADSDGARAVECGGDDCDDSDPLAFPGAAEVCDVDGRDEDCEPSTFGPDLDGDGFVGSTCCNRQPDGALACGGDCNDMNREVNPDAIEVCNGLDDNCDGALDPVLEDVDGDGWAGCVDLPAAMRDCDDGEPATHPGAVELCDGVDNDCDGSARGEDLDGDGFLATDAGCSGGPRGGFPRTDCHDGQIAINPDADERCDSVDHDCDGSVDEAPSSASCPSDSRTTYACVMESCSVAACGAGFGDCDASDGNGCEQALDSVAHCGACGVSCAWECGSSLCADPTAVTSGYDHSCAVTSAGRVRCWGANDLGQLGLGSTSMAPSLRPAATVERVTMPIGVAPLEGVAQVGVGTFFSCARLGVGEVYCWGADDRAQLGQGGSSSTPRTLARRLLHRDASVAFDDAEDLSVGALHACSALTSGEVVCWGSNDDQQAGGGANPLATPRTVPGLVGVVEVSAGNESTCALHGTGRVSCWGSNDSGQLGRGTTGGDFAVPAEVVAPVAPGPLTGITQVAVGDDHACALTSAAEVVCWGANDFGQLGDGSLAARSRPVRVLESGAPLGGVEEISVGWSHSCARLSSGEVRCWGRNQIGQLGDGTSTTRSAPVAVRRSGAALTGTTSLGAANLHTCALRGSEVVCWGLNATGQLGDGTRSTRLEAVPVLPPL